MTTWRDLWQTVIIVRGNPKKKIRTESRNFMTEILKDLQRMSRTEMTSWLTSSTNAEDSYVL